MNLSDSLKNDLVVDAQRNRCIAWGFRHDVNVILFILDGDLTLLDHVIFADDVDIPLGEILESRPLRDDEGVRQLSTDHDRAGLTVTEETIWIRKIRPEEDSSRLVVEFGLDRANRALDRELAVVGQTQFNIRTILALTHFSLVFEVALLGDGEINPHHAVVGQGGEDISLFDQTALKVVKAVDNAVERRFDRGKVQFGLCLLPLGDRLGQLGLQQRHLSIRDRVPLVQLQGVVVLLLGVLDLGDLGIESCLVKHRVDLEQQIPLLNRLAFLDRDGLEIAALQRLDFHVFLRMDLADILLLDGDFLGHGLGDEDLVPLVVFFPLRGVLLEVRLIFCDDVFFGLLGLLAKEFKMFGPSLRERQERATSENGDQQESYDRSPFDECDGIHGPYCPSGEIHRGIGKAVRNMSEDAQRCRKYKEASQPAIG